MGHKRTDHVEPDWSDGANSVIVIFSAVGFQNEKSELVVGQVLKTVTEVL